ncbi:hypothetical protein QLQ12_26100 [Actinoplanes sp. NEAU-A12]|uniref:Uncharacterized protein n=1 Tax=Actinoplanes sandaracinus TaxID=3045177 RepID=A0ABT6WR33_9ACTN|nr:hypothetical protein [Actinoplanes sandaracinus]
MISPRLRRHLPELGGRVARRIPRVVGVAGTHAFRAPSKDGPLYTS